MSFLDKNFSERFTPPIINSVFSAPFNMDDAVRYRLLKLLHAHPHLTQRELAQAMGISLGKANFCLRALIAAGVVKVNNFRNSVNKAAYLYNLTPRGLEEKARVTRRFLLHKMAEYEAIRQEIEELRADVKQCGEE